MATGKAIAALNSKVRQIGPRSTSEILADHCKIMCLMMLLEKAERQF
jgi:hypothetical protein